MARWRSLFARWRTASVRLLDILRSRRRLGRRWAALMALGAMVAVLFVVYQGWLLRNRLGSLPSGPLLSPDGVPGEGTSGVAVGLAGPPEKGTTSPANPASGRIALVAAGPPEPPALRDELRPSKGGVPFVLPVPDAQVVPPGWRRHGEGGYWYYETAVVLRAPAGSGVVAAAPGVVRAIEPEGNGSWRIAVDHGDGVETQYGNVFHVTVVPGAHLSAHAPLGVVGPFAAQDAAGSDGAGPSISFAAQRDGHPLEGAGLFANGQALGPEPQAVGAPGAAEGPSGL